MDLNKEMNYIDGVTIVNTEGTILFTIKFNPEVGNRIEESIVGKNLFDVFYNLDKSNSSLYECMYKDRLVERKAQLVKNVYFEDIVSDNISFPIKHGGIIVGAIELSKSIIEKKDNDKKKLAEKDRKETSFNIRPKTINLGHNATYSLDDIICKDKRMCELIAYANHIAKAPSSVFIVGETGTGKELFAQGIHNASDRKNKPFIAQNCSAVPENLLESIFFGTSKGSYTGAIDKKGLFEACHEGTLFLDELHSMPIYLQSKLLRAIEKGAARRIGENKERSFDVRIIAATNIGINEILKNNYIRDDLYYRLSVVNIDIPPLRERVEDIKILSEHFIEKYNGIFGKNINHISSEVNNFMLAYDWPGNVRELENFIESSILNASEFQTELKDIELYRRHNKYDTFIKSRPMKKILESMEVKLIEEALLRCKRNVKKASEFLEIPRQTLQQKMKKYNINK